MRTLTVIVASAFAVSSLLACGGGGGGGGGGGDGGAFSLKGKVGTVQAPHGTVAARASAIAVGDVKTVLALSTGNRWWSSPVAADGTFSLELDPSTPVGLVFVNSTDQLVGYLALSNGLASLPLQTLSPDTVSLDLGTLLPSAQVFTPESGLAGFSLAGADLTALLNAGGIFAETVKNPDADGDGKVDILQGVYYRPYVMYFVNPGSFSGEQAVVSPGTLTLNGYRLGVHASRLIGGSPYPPSVTFTGPDGSGLDGEANEGTPNISTREADYQSIVPDVLVPPEGVYGVTMGTTELSFQIPDQADAIAQIAMAVPRVTLNQDGTIHQIDWSYQLGGLSDGASTVDPASLVDSMMLQIDANPADPAFRRCAASNIRPSEGPTRIYDAGQVAADVTTEVMDCQDLPWSIVTRIHMAYNDVYGNHVVVSWAK